MEPKFTLDRPKVSDDEINSRKDFDGLVKQFKEQSIEKARSDKSFLKNKKATYATVIAGVAVVCTVTYLAVFNKKQTNLSASNDKIITQNSKNIHQEKKQKAFVAPPVKRLDVPYSKYKVNAQKGSDIVHHSSSKINVPKNAFVNQKGEDIVGEVEIQYREFHNQADIIVSGIPMTYDSAGTQYHFESAGMFDIRGYQNGEPVFIKQGSEITVDMTSMNSADRFNQYYLDTIARNWKCLKKDNPKPDESTSSNEIKLSKASGHDEPALTSPKLSVIQKQIDVIPKKIDSVNTVYTKKISILPTVRKPSQPQKSSGRPQFEMDVDYKEFPELSAFKDAVFEVGDENKNYRKELHNITWSSATISEGPQKGKNYLLTLKSRQIQEKLVVYPVLTGENFATAQKQYEKKFDEYNTLLAKREADEKRLKDEMLAKQKAYLEEQKKLDAEALKERIRIRREMEQQLAEQFKSANKLQNVRRIFMVSNFGIYNSDCPNSMPGGATVHGVLAVSENELPLRPETIFLVDHEKVAVYNLPNSKISYTPGKEYSIAVLSKGQLYLCSKAQFKKTVSEGKNKFIVKALPVDVDDAAELKKALEI